ncbi:predicted protein [Naegleria gruberi]|uniref:Predicted protein n=1 Tax=Naegleria gruberi TaxID=5762 RepID=D2VZG4_NAEGR|nr:uncharacterized protein NAEGRDRAFT_74480 [Naegleria gruberi]EFC37788.1 predicted protein [Naegleria gruberi]|eukprot:XP_002670532.1 predicted protein [Naegleria gruberi strain NEG-M]
MSQQESLDAPPIIEQMVMQSQMFEDPITGEMNVSHTYVKPNCGGGKYHGELIDVRIKAKKAHDLYQVIVKPHDQKVMKGIGSVRVLHNDQELVADSSNFGSESSIDLDFKASNGMKVVVEIDWKYK